MTLVQERSGTVAAPNRRFLGGTPASLLVWCGVIAVASAWGGVLLLCGVYLSSIGAPPLWGHFGLILSPGILVAIPVSATAILFVPRLSSTLTWRRLLIVAPLIAFAWACALTFTAGGREIVRPVLLRSEYLFDVPRVGSPVTFLHHFVGQIGGYATHVRAHPPGMVLLLWGMARAGLGGPWPAALFMIAGGAATVPAVLVAIRELSGETAARAAAPFLAVAPAAIWIATSADAFFAGVSAWAVTLIVLATGRRDRRGDVYALAGGVLFGAALMLSYGLIALAAIPLVVAWDRRRARPLVLASAGTLAVLGAFGMLGFSWIAGFFATRHEYEIFRTRFRPYSYFLFANIAAFAVALGPAVFRALAGLRDRGVWLLVTGGLLAVAASDLSGLSKGEVERIWLPFLPWVLAGTASLTLRARGWLAGQVGVALLLALVLRTAW